MASECVELKSMGRYRTYALALGAITTGCTRPFVPRTNKNEITITTIRVGSAPRGAVIAGRRPHDHHQRYLQKATEHIENTMWEPMSECTSENGGKRKIPAGMWEKKWKEICP